MERLRTSFFLPAPDRVREPQPLAKFFAISAPYERFRHPNKHHHRHLDQLDDEAVGSSFRSSVEAGEVSRSAQHA